ncbi:MAG: hypothetical protein PWQ37_27 [Candidatus Petromonas sp.]|jgi:hypothetical protein|nr:hypothetical protein [Candidatus Petromonas sp.]
MTPLEELKFNLRESENPYFDDTELQVLLDKNQIGVEDDGATPIYDINAATYEGLLIKAEDDSIKLPGLDIPSSQKYYLRLARLFRPSRTCNIKRADEL